MREVKVSELKGAALDWAVARAEGYSWHLERGAYGSGFHVVVKLPEPSVDRLVVFRPSSDWGQGGPLIDKNPMEIYPNEWRGGVRWLSWVKKSINLRPISLQGETLLIATCRAIVAVKLGDVVSIPEELME